MADFCSAQTSYHWEEDHYGCVPDTAYTISDECWLEPEGEPPPHRHGRSVRHRGAIHVGLNHGDSGAVKLRRALQDPDVGNGARLGKGIRHDNGGCGRSLTQGLPLCSTGRRRGLRCRRGALPIGFESGLSTLHSWAHGFGVRRPGRAHTSAAHEPRQDDSPLGVCRPFPQGKLPYSGVSSNSAVVPLTSLPTTSRGVPVGLSSALMNTEHSGPRSPAVARSAGSVVAKSRVFR